MKILVTGGAGYKGSSLVPVLLSNHQVDVLDYHISPECTLIPFTKNKNFNENNFDLVISMFNVINYFKDFKKMVFFF